jgi:hypothetical protein
MIQYSTTTLTFTRFEYVLGSFPLPHSFVDFLFFYSKFPFFFSSYLASSLPPRARQQNTLQVATRDETDIRVPITVPPALTASSRSFTFPFFSTVPLASRSRTTLYRRYHAAAVRPLLISF